jgi:ectoine hydroxylase-related dioxygenase (phytanoyl-CoA dioxygenase family)
MDVGLQQQLRDDGYAVLPSLLSVQELQAARDGLDVAVAAVHRLGIPTHTESLDPNASNVRVYNLPELCSVFIDLLRHPATLSVVREVLSPNCLVSNFTANIAWPGSGSMNLHSDQALVIPPPWNEPWAFNVIWCLDDVHERNGATRYLPGSHRYRTFEDVPADALTKTRAFEAPAGSAILMEGRIWHTSGANVTSDERRAMLFAYYSMDFIRQQMNWEAALSPKTKESLDAETCKLLGLGPAANTRIGGQLTRLSGSRQGLTT